MGPRFINNITHITTTTASATASTTTTYTTTTITQKRRADILRGQMIKMNSNGSQGSQVSQGGGSGSNTTTPISNTTVTPGSMIPKPSPRKNIVQRGQSQSPR